jgi:putative NIF3 family GTP cyclohydrolase 1 type 2
LGGSGSYDKKAISAGADAFLTADLKYHQFMKQKTTSLADIGF